MLIRSPSAVNASFDKTERFRTSALESRELVEAGLAIALFDAHCEDPEFGYRFQVDGAR